MSTETLLLRGIDPIAISKKYAEGFFATYIAQKSGGRRVEITPQDVGTNQYSARYDRKTDRAVYRICTTNNASFNHITNNTSPDITGQRCHGCHVLLSERLSGTEEEPKYLVVRMTEREGVTCFEPSTGWYCDTACAEMRRRELSNDLKQGVVYRNAAPVMRHYHYLLTGNHNIPSREHWMLLREYGGPLDHAEYFGSSQQYVRLPNVVYFPTKQQYETKLMDLK